MTTDPHLPQQAATEPDQTRSRPTHRRRRSRVLLAASVLAVAGLVATLNRPGHAAATPVATRARTASATAATVNDQSARTRERATLQRLARQVVDAGAPSVIVTVDDGHGHPIRITEQAPWARKDERLRVGDEFRMASNTKTVMATLTLQLAAEGRLALTDPVEKWLPGWIPNGKAITLRMLLNHTSGLFDYTGDPAVIPSTIGRDQRRWTAAELIAVAVKHPPLFAPGKQFSYSNTNFIAIGAVLERASGQSLATLVRDRISGPLHLRHTYYAPHATWRGRHVHGYEPDAAHMPAGVPAASRDIAGRPVHGHVDVTDNDLSWGGSAGSVISNAEDWQRFYRALMSGRLLAPAQLGELRTTVPIFPDQPNGPGEGLGIQTGATPCGTVWGHDGGIAGYFSTPATDDTGSRTMDLLIPTEAFGEFPDAFPKLDQAARDLHIAAICAMFDKPAPATHAG